MMLSHAIASGEMNLLNTGNHDCFFFAKRTEIGNGNSKVITAMRLETQLDSRWITDRPSTIYDSTIVVGFINLAGITRPSSLYPLVALHPDRDRMPRSFDANRKRIVSSVMLISPDSLFILNMSCTDQWNGLLVLAVKVMELYLPRISSWWFNCRPPDMLIH